MSRRHAIALPALATRSFPPRIATLTLLLSLIAAQSSPASAHEPGEEEAVPLRTAPVLFERVEPLYPQAARAKGIGGLVKLAITVAADGAVSDVKVTAGAGFGLDEAALAATRRFKFKPATEQGRPIASTVLFEQSFSVTPRFSAEASADPPPPDGAPSTQPADAPRYEATVRDRGPSSAASASTIRNQDFDLRPKNSPNDLLRVVPGLLAVQHQGGGKADQLFLRGFDADHGTDVGVFVDGIPVNLPSHAHGQGFADLHWIIPEAFDRIEVVKGPYDARYGDFSTGGAVNLVTRDSFDNSSVQLQLAGFPTLGCKSFPVNCKVVAQQRLVAIVSPKFGGWAKSLSTWVAFEAAHDDGPFQNNMGLQRYNLFAKLAWQLSPGTTLGAFFSGYGSAWLGSGQIPSREVDAGRLSQFGALDPSEGGLTQRLMATAFLRHKSADREFNATLYYTRYKLALWNDFTFFLGDPDKGDAIEQDDDRHVVGLKLNYHFHHRLRSLSFRTTVGAEIRYDGTQVDLWDSTSQGGEFRKRVGRHVDGGDFPFGNNSSISLLNLSAYAEEDVVFTRWLRALVALRGDYFGFSVDDKGERPEASGALSGVKQKAVASPKATVVLTPIRPLDIYLNFGMGFHSNDARIAVLDGRTTRGGSVVNTVPRIFGGEIGARLTLWNRLSLAGAFWVSYLENETVFVGDGGVFEPSDPTRRFGVDLEARVQALSWLSFDFDLAQAASTSVPNHGNGGAIALAPKLYMTGGATVKHTFQRGGGRHSVRGGLRFRYLGDRPAFNENSDEYRLLNPSDPRRVNAGGYFIVDLYGSYRYRFLEVSLSAQNLFNSTWREAQFGNASCTRAEVDDPAHPTCGRTLAPDQRTGVPDVHFTPGVPLNLQLGVKAYF